jgi:hypothetical protein
LQQNNILVESEMAPCWSFLNDFNRLWQNSREVNCLIHKREPSLTPLRGRIPPRKELMAQFSADITPKGRKI